MTPHAVPGGFDATPLTERVSPGAVQGYENQLRASGMVPYAFTSTGTTVDQIVRSLGLVLAIAFGGLFAFILVITVLTGGSVMAALGNLIIVGVLIAIAGAIARSSRRARDRAPERWYRMARLALANRWTYHPAIRDRPLPGLLGSQGYDPETTDIVRLNRPRPTEIGTHRYREDSETVVIRGYLSLRLVGVAPPAVLTRSHAVGSRTRLPRALQRWQRSDLGPGWRLYTERGQEAAVRRILHPGLVVELQSCPIDLDAELVGDRLMLYASAGWDGTDVREWTILLTLVARLDAALGRP
ncbi:hypothetical protein [Millisia brevis]|uniref:hypothetical protein n=1 Tax=Millisia brevis TaxID=264148 RepID=UPI0008377F29|nr:hypothetical protein [Millisia brevis]